MLMLMERKYVNCDHQGAAGPFHSSMEVLGRHPWAQTEMPMQVAGPARQRERGWGRDIREDWGLHWIGAAYHI